MTSTAAHSWAQLCELVGDLLHDHPCDPLAHDLVVVPSVGHRRALSQALATRGGGPAITAGLEFVTAAALAHRLAQPLVDAGLLAADGWRGVRLRLGIMELLADPKHAAALADVVRHVGAADDRPGRAFTTASRLASVFHRYAQEAPTMVAGWRVGDDRDVHGDPLADMDQWQPHLWRALLAGLGPDPAERTDTLLELIRRGPVPGLPHRIVVAQVDDPEPAQAALLAALAVHHEVDIFALSGLAATPADVGSPFARQHGSRPALAPASQKQPAASSHSVLAQVQHELRTDAPPKPRRTADSSLQIHACHGPNRQVEVLRDVLCGLFTDDPTLQPRDVVVLCPSLADYAPLISASFGLSSEPDSGFHPGHRLRAQLAAPALAAANPVLSVLERCFELREGRATSVDLVDLCRLPPVALRFGFDRDALDRIHQLVARAEIRWGIDIEQRRRNGVPVASSTWLAGIQRMLVSLALDDTPPVALQTTTPLPFIEGGDAWLIGSLAELVSRVRKVCRDFETPATAESWVARLRQAIDLLAATDPRDDWQLDHAREELARLADESAGLNVELGSGDVANWLADRARSWRRRPNYGNGSLLFTSLDDLATVEARVVCILGLDDDHFPGAPRVDGDDLLSRPGPTPRHWSTDRRARRRQRLLDAVMAAQQSLVVITQGASESTGDQRPMPLCIAGVMETCAVTGPKGSWRGTSGQGTLVRWHPMHPHGWGDFTSEGSQPPASFDAQALKGARRLTEAVALPPPRWGLEHSTHVAPELDIDELVDFFRHPARELLRRATGTTLGGFDNSLEVDLPLDTDWLSSWRIGQALFDLLVAGHDPKSAMESVWLGGLVLPGEPGRAILTEQLDRALPTAQATLAVRNRGLEQIDCSVELAGYRVSGRIPLFDGMVEAHRFGADRIDDFLSVWLRLVLLSAAEAATPHSQLSGVAIANRSWQFQAPEPGPARQWLLEAVRLRAQGLSHVLPLPLAAASAYADFTGYSPSNDAMDRAASKYPRSDENWRYFYSGFQDLIAAAPLPTDPASTAGTAPTRFEQLADWLTEPLKQNRRSWRAAEGRP